MHIQHNIPLKPYNTFGIDVKAKYFVSVSSKEELIQVLGIDDYPNKLILGGGSNMLLTKDIDALVIHVNIKGINISEETPESVIVTANAGENWHQVVLWCLDKNFGGIENLSLIPGNIGTAPIQNIGAYGVELKDVFVSCQAIDIKTKQEITFKLEDCDFGYRNSIFKNGAKGQYIIISVSLKLSKGNHQLHTEYGAIQSELQNMNVSKPTIQDVSKAVISIRESKLPNPKDIGNSGSFFKNPVIPLSHYESLKSNFPDIPCYPVSDSEVKVPAGWLIEKSGFKGKRLGNYGVHNKQALVLVNYGNAKGGDIYALAILIKKTVARLFNISIEPEVNVL